MSLLAALVAQWRELYIPHANLSRFVADASPKVQQAFAVMMFAHAAQRRKGPLNRPYAVHPLMVYLLVKTATNDEDTLVAALLHDVVEDMKKSFPGVKQKDVLNNIRTMFGHEAARLVAALTNPDSFGDLTKIEWQLQHFRKFPEIQLIKVADKLVNTYDSLFDTPDWSREKLVAGLADAETFLNELARKPDLYDKLGVFLRRAAESKGWL